MIHRGNEPGIRGSYSFVPVGATGKDIDELAKPEGAEMSLAFAGEHTHRTILGLLGQLVCKPHFWTYSCGLQFQLSWFGSSNLSSGFTPRFMVLGGVASNLLKCWWPNARIQHR